MVKSIPSGPFRKCNQSFKIFVTKYKYKLFNKNLNFYLIPEKCNKNKGKTKQENHDINQLNYEENIAPKKSSWKLDKNHHTVNTFIEAIDNVIEN